MYSSSFSVAPTSQNNLSNISFAPKFKGTHRGNKKIMMPQRVVPFDFLTALSLSELLCVSFWSNSTWGWDAAAAKDPHGVWGAQCCPAEARGEHACRCGATRRRRDAGEGTKQPPPPTSGDAAPGTHLQLLLPASARWEPVSHWSVAEFPQHHKCLSLLATVSEYKCFKAMNTHV